MRYQIQTIKPEHDSKVCEIIKRVGKEYGAIGEGFGPSEPEVDAMSQYYREDNSSLYLVATVEDNIVACIG
jgi:putative acetyltransferase